MDSECVVHTETIVCVTTPRVIVGSIQEFNKNRALALEMLVSADTHTVFGSHCYLAWVSLTTRMARYIGADQGDNLKSLCFKHKTHDTLIYAFRRFDVQNIHSTSSYPIFSNTNFNIILNSTCFFPSWFSTAILRMLRARRWQQCGRWTLRKFQNAPKLKHSASDEAASS